MPLEKTKNSSIFSRLFPAPKLLRMPAAGINISDHSIKILEMEDFDGRKIVKKYGDEPIPKGIMQNGHIIDRLALKKSLLEVKKKYDLRFIRATLPEEKAYVFKTESPLIDDKRAVKSNLEFKLEEFVPISSNEATFDFTFIKPGLHKKEDHHDVVVFAIPQKVVASYMDLFHSAGLFPLSLEIEAESLARALIDKDDLKTYMIVDYGRTRTGISIVSRGVVRYTSTLESGGEIITETLIKHLGVSAEEAEKIKNEKGFMGGRKNADIYNTLAASVSALRDEINRRIIYWHTHKDKETEIDETIKKIILCGGNANLRGLPEYFSSSLKIPVERGNVWKNVLSFEKEIPEINQRISLTYASVIGLSLSSFDI